MKSVNISIVADSWIIDGLMDSLLMVVDCRLVMIGDDERS